MKKMILLAMMFLFYGISYTTISAQNLTISSSGQTSTSGTNWSIVGNTLTVAASGSAEVHPSVITNHLNTVGDLTISLPPQSSVARNIVMNSGISYTGATPRNLIINAANNILFANGAGITSSTAALNVVLRAAIGSNPDYGRVNLDGTTISTKGGHFWLGGGNQGATWNELPVGANTAQVWSDDISALSMIGGSLVTEGGSVYLAALSWESSDNDGVNYGIYIDNYTISSGSGSISINGSLNGRFTSGVATRIFASTGSVSISTTSGGISINGTGTDQINNGNSWRVGTFISGTSNIVSATVSSVSGAISINGNANFSATINDKEGLILSGNAVSIVSQTGNLELKGSNSLETSGQYSNSIRFAPSNVTNAIRIGFNGTNAYSGNILIEGNSIYQRDNHSGVGSISIQSTGTLTIQPSGSSFTNMRSGNSGSLTFDDDWNFGSQLSGFTYGKATNTMNLSLASALLVAGSASIYAGNLTLNQNLTSTLSGSNILVQATGAINLASSRTIQSNGGSITFRSNSAGAALSAASSIILNSGSTLNSQGGNITLGGNFTGAQGAGLYATSNNAPAILIDGGSISAAGGTIKLYGKCNASYDDGIRLRGTINTTGTGTIELYGEAHGGNNGTDYFGGITFGSSEGSTIETENGNIILNGFLTNTQSNATGAINFYRNDGSTGQTRHINLLSKTGNININADIGSTGAYGIGHSSWGNVHIGSPVSGWTATGNIVLSYARLVNAGFNGFKVKTTGAVTYQPNGSSFTAAQTFPANSNYILAESASSLTIGKSVNTADITITQATSVAGPITIYGGYVNINGNLTSSANGDIFIKGVASTNPSIQLQSGKTITKSGGTGTLTFQGHGRVQNSGTISTSGTGVLNLVLWSDFDNSNNDGGVTHMGTISTNSGHVWMGGSNSNGGSYTWNGLTVGDGPSIGTSGYNCNAMDLFGHITTSGGDVLLWAGNGGCGASGIVANDGWHVNVGNGDIVLITPYILGTGPSLFFRQNGGTFTMVPNGTSFPNTVDWSPILGTYGTMTGWNLPGDFNYLWIENPSTLTNFTLGRYNGMTNGGTPVVMTNSSNITIAQATSIAGSMNFFGGAIAVNANIATTNATTGNISLNGTTLSGIGNIAIASNRIANLNFSSTSTYNGIISGTGSGLTKSGTGFLTLTKDHTYSGATTISAGDLQVGTGGSVSQASSGTISNTSGVTIASGSKLILSPNENIVFAAPISGAGGVEIKGASGTYFNAFLTGTAATIATNSSVLEVLTRITGGLMDGQQVMGSGSLTAGAYVKSYDAAANTASLQFQQFDGQYTKSVFAVLSQSGTNVQIRANISIYNGAAYRTGNHLGANMATGSIQMGLATSSTGTGYGIGQVYLSGKVNFTGVLSYAGNTILSNTVTSVTSPNTYSYTSKGTQEITDASSSFPPTSNVINNGLVIFNRTTPLTISSDMEGTEDVLQVGADITLTGTNTHSGNTTIDLNRKLIIGSGSTIGSIAGNIVNYGTLTFDRSDASTHAGVISGSGSLVKSGAGTHTLTGLNTYAGATTINAGKLVLERDVPITSSNGFSGAGELVIQPSSASFTNALNYPLSGFTVSSTIGGLTIGKLGNTANLTVTNTTSANGPITFYSGTITLNANVTANNNGDISFYSDNAIGGLSVQRNVTAAGLFNYIPQSNSFNATVTYPITNLNVSCTGLLIGKTSNTSTVTFGNTTSINGPITAYGWSININENLSSSSGGTISLFGNSLTFGSNKTVTSSGELIVAPQNQSNSIGLAGATGTLQLPLTYFTTHFTNGFSTIQIGSNTQTGNISSNDFTLLDNMKILTSGSLTLGGKPILASNNLTLGSAISSFSGMPSHYFQTNGTGKVIRNLSNTSTLQFPIGNSSYNPVSIKNNSGSADDFSVRVLDVIEDNPNLSAIKHVNRTWDIGKTTSNAGAGIDFIFNWNAAEIVNGPLANPILNHFGTYWETAIGSSAAAAGSPILSLTHTGYTGTFSPFAISDASTPLPVSMAFFNLNCAEDNVELNWQTASEHNSSHFVVERSLDGMEWEKLGEVASAGNSTSMLNYSFIDVSLLARTLSYYRLIQVDFDGESETYGPLSSNCEAINAFELVIAPNPSAGKFTIKVDTKRSQEMDVHIYHTDGKEVANEIISAAEGTSLHYINMEDLASGIYTLYVQHKGGTISRKIVIL